MQNYPRTASAGVADFPDCAASVVRAEVARSNALHWVGLSGSPRSQCDPLLTVASQKNQRKAPRWSQGFAESATSLWLHFVASPQRVPVYGHRRRGRPV